MIAFVFCKEERKEERRDKGKDLISRVPLYAFSLALGLGLMATKGGKGDANAALQKISHSSKTLDSPKSFLKNKFLVSESSKMHLNSKIPKHISWGEGNTLRLMTFNVALLKNPVTKVSNTLDILKVVDSTNPDIAVFQEVVSGKEFLKLDKLMKSKGYVHSLNAFNYRGLGHLGNVLYSKVPLKKSSSFNLPLTLKGHRNVLKAEIDLNGSKFVVLATHLSHGKDPSRRVKEIAMIQPIIDKSIKKGHGKKIFLILRCYIHGRLEYTKLPRSKFSKS